MNWAICFPGYIFSLGPENLNLKERCSHPLDLLASLMCLNFMKDSGAMSRRMPGRTRIMTRKDKKGACKFSLRQAT